MPGRVRTGRTIGDYSPCALTFSPCLVEIMRHHSCGPGSPLPSPAVPYQLLHSLFLPSLTISSGSSDSLANTHVVFYKCSSQ